MSLPDKSPTDVLGWGLIGASTIAHEYMIAAIEANADSRVGAVYSTSRERGGDFARNHRIPKVYDDLSALLSDEEVAVVYISTTNDRHAAEAIAAAGCGKHVLCEKPLATNLADAAAVVTACREAGVVLGTNHHLPNAVTHRAVRKVLASGRIGTPLAVRIFHARSLPRPLQTWRVSDPSAGAGVILDVTVHDAALLRFLLDSEIVAVTAVALQQSMALGSIEDAVMGVMETDCGVPAQFHDAWTIAHAGTGLEVHGTEASVIAREAMTSDPVGSVAIRRFDAVEEVEIGEPEDLYAHAVAHFNAAVMRSGVPFVSGEDGLRAVAVALAAKESALRGERVRVPSLENVR